MTREEFKNSSFGANTLIRIQDGTIHKVASVDFEQDLIAITGEVIECEICGEETFELRWIRCENCDLI